MFNTLINAFKVDATYRTNAFIYTLRKLFFLKPIIPISIYKTTRAKLFFNILALIFNLLYHFVTKALYVGLMIYLPATYIPGNIANNFVTIFLFLTMLGAFAMTTLLKADSKKYYCVILMRMQAKPYAVFHYLGYLLKIFITFLPSTIIFANLCQLGILEAILLVIMVICLKAIGDALELYVYNQKKILFSEKFTFFFSMLILMILGAYGFPLFGYALAPLFVEVLLPVLVLFGIIGLKYVISNQTYPSIYKNIVTVNKVIFNTDQVMKDSQASMVKMDTKNVSLRSETQKKKGYDFFNSIFLQRHKRILWKSILRMSAILLAIISVAVLACVAMPEVKSKISEILMTWLPYFVFILYIINRGQIITQAMFYNCDHSMLTYNFYRRPKDILKNFTIRLKMVMKLNLVPATILAFGLVVLLFVTNATTNPITYVSVFLSIIFMGMFFSVHYLAMYYLFQPYDINMNNKGKLYTMASSLTYLACFFCMQIKVDTLIFSIGTIFITLIYMLIVMYATYRLAPKTFKLK